MSLDNSIALVSLEEYKALAGVTTEVNEADDPAIAEYINAASQAIITFTGRKWISATATDELFAGTGLYYYDVINGGSISVSSAPSYWNGTSWTATTLDYSTESDIGRVYFTKGGTFHKFNPESYKNWKITYTYGYTQSKVPSPLKMACVGMVEQFKKLLLEGKYGVTAESKGELQTTYLLHDMPNNIRALLMPYKRIKCA